MRKSFTNGRPHTNRASAETEQALACAMTVHRAWNQKMKAKNRKSLAYEQACSHTTHYGNEALRSTKSLCYSDGMLDIIVFKG